MSHLDTHKKYLEALAQLAALREENAEMRDELGIIGMMSNIPEHKKTDTEFMRGTLNICASRAHAALQRAKE